MCNKGVLLSKLGKEEEALKLFDQALEIKPAAYDSLCNKGALLSNLGKQEEAIKLYDQALEINPDNHDSLRNKGISLSNLGKQEEAIKLYDQALEINPDDHDSLRNKGVSLSKLGKQEEAIKLYDQALEIKPDDYVSFREKGASLGRLGKQEEAIKLFDHALEIKPDDYTSLRNKGVSLSELGKQEEAIKFFDHALEINPDDYNSLREKGALLSNLEKQEEAIKLFDHALEIKPDDYASLRNKGVVLGKLGNEEGAIKFFDQALEVKPDDYDSLQQKGVSLSELGKGAEALKLFDQVLEINPDDYNSLRNKGISLSKLGRVEEALKLFDQALEIEPDDYNSLRQKGVVLSKLGNEEEAIKLFDHALEINPDDYNSLREKGALLSNLEKQEEAIKLFDQALEIKPDDWLTLTWKVYALEAFDRNDDAKTILKWLQKNQDVVKNPDANAWVNFKLDHLESKTKDSTPQEMGKSSDILNKVINAFQGKKDDFFKSIYEIESNFKKFTDTKRSIPEGSPSFLSVLRKWNSYTPIIPSEKGDNKGGGYFLYHCGKGFVIDPGFNFIENFYQEGFKVADIDAVLITHAHNDHTVDLESILTLIYKHNDAIIDSVKEEMKGKNGDIESEIKTRTKEHGKKIDLFLNVGTFMKYSGWLNLKDSGEINNVTVLQPDTTYKLSKDYDGIVIHTIKAKHHEIIDNKYAIGFILNVGGTKVGFTGDTGWDFENDGRIANEFSNHKPGLVIAHLGSIKSKEFKYVGAENEEERNKCFYTHHLGLLGMTKFLDTVKPDLTIISEFGEELRHFRKEIVEGIGEVLELNCLPGDIGLHVRLNDLGVHCFIDNEFIDYKKIEVYSKKGDSTILFHREETDHGKFETALDGKKMMRAVPLSDRRQK